MYALTKKYLEETLTEMRFLMEESDNYKEKLRYNCIIENIKEILTGGY